MTGSTELTREQLQTLSNELLNLDTQLVRVVLHPEQNGYEKDVRVVTRTLAYGDVLEGHFYILANGRKLTEVEYRDLLR